METAQSDKKETSLAIIHFWFTLQKHLCCKRICEKIWSKFEDTLKISKCSKKSKNFCILDNPSIDDSKIINAYGLFDKVFLKENK